MRIDYCKRSIEQVLDDVAVYSGWSKNHESDGIYVEGIFLDESPNEYTADIGKYLNVVSARIKEAPGILGQKLVSPRTCNILFNRRQPYLAYMQLTSILPDHSQPRHDPGQGTHRDAPRSHCRVRRELRPLPLMWSERAQSA